MVAAGDPIYASDFNDHITDREAITSATTNSSATSGTTELLIDTVTMNVVSGLLYEIEWNVPFSGTVTDDRFFLLLRLGNGTGGTQLKFITVEINNQFDAVVKARWVATSTGSQTFSGTARRSSGTGTLTAGGAATNPRQLSVELKE